MYIHHINYFELNQDETYLEKSLLFDPTCRSLIHWANGEFGAMADLNNDNVMHFISYHYEPGTGNSDYDIREKYLTKEEKTSPIVAEGIVVYWLKEHHGNLSTAQIFEKYYELCKQRYIRKEEKSLNAFERDLPREFAMRRHLTYEVDRIEKSEAIFPYLNEKDVNTIKQLTGYYINYVRKKGKELFPPQYTKGCEKTETFLHVYETTAKNCVEWICDEYDLPPMGPHHGEDRGKKILNYEWYNNHHNKKEPRYIRWGYHDFDACDLYYKNSEIMEEINVNLSKCMNQDARVRYVIKLLSSFKDFAQPFYPMGINKEWRQSIEDLKKSKLNWENVADDDIDETTGKPLDPKGQVKACEREIERLEADIKYRKEKARKLFDICQEAIRHHEDNEEVSMELCLFCFWSEMIRFYRRLTALLLTYKLKLMDIQEKCGVYLNWYVHLSDYVDEKYVPNYGYAKQLLSEIEGTNVIATSSVDIPKLPSEKAPAEIPCQIPQSHIVPEHAQVIPDEDWDDTYDYIFDERVMPKAIKVAIDGIGIPNKISNVRFFYVTCRILEILQYLTKKASRPDFLRWVNLHFNCGWIDDKEHRKQFVFALEGSSKNLEDQHPSDWDEKTIKGGSGKYHHQLAVTIKNTFTETVINGIADDDSESFEHLRDRGHFLRYAYHVKDNIYFIPDNAYINNGK